MAANHIFTWFDTLKASWAPLLQAKLLSSLLEELTKSHHRVHGPFWRYYSVCVKTWKNNSYVKSCIFVALSKCFPKNVSATKHWSMRYISLLACTILMESSSRIANRALGIFLEGNQNTFRLRIPEKEIVMPLTEILKPSMHQVSNFMVRIEMRWETLSIAFWLSSYKDACTAY